MQKYHRSDRLKEQRGVGHHFLLPVLAILTVGAIGTFLLKGSNANSAVDTSALKHTVGLYYIPNPNDVPAAVQETFTYGLKPYNRADKKGNRVYKEQKMAIIDSKVHEIIYSAYCPKGQASCKNELSSAELEALGASVKSQVLATKEDGNVAAYYILDDYWTDMRAGLEASYATIRSVDSKTPTICGFVQDLAYRRGENKELQYDFRAFRKALRNYSPKWCDSVGIYSYGPRFDREPGTPLRTNHQTEWSMAHTLPKALNILKKKGWDKKSQPLIGMPMAFGYNPRTNAPWAPGKWSYWPGPSQKSLARQTAAFCKYGAVSIMPYVWNDGASSEGAPNGRIRELYNSPGLRQGIRDGVQTCRQQYWK